MISKEEYINAKRITELYDKEQEKLAYLAREEKQSNCIHDWRYDGHGHNYDDYVCKKCGLTEER